MWKTQKAKNIERTMAKGEKARGQGKVGSTVQQC